MNANGRLCRKFAKGFSGFAKICGRAVRGGRPIYTATAGLSIAQAIERERAIARRQMQIKAKKK